MEKQTYIIQQGPIGLSAPKSGIDILKGISVSAEIKNNTVLVSKDELVAAITPISQPWADFWNSHTENEFTFPIK
jgi:hypothetical protein